MSQENVRIVEQVLEASSNDEFDTVVALHDPDWEGFIPHEYPVAGTWRGHAGLRAFAEEWRAAWDEFRVEAEEFIDGDDAVGALLGSGSRQRRGNHRSLVLRVPAPGRQDH